MNQLEALKAMTIVVADTGDIEAIRQYQPEDATTNPSLILSAAALPQYAPLIDNAIAYGKKQSDDRAQQLIDAEDKLAVNIGLEILNFIPGRISTEVDARLSYDTAATIAKARKIIALYQAAGVGRERILIKIAATWQGIRAAETLEKERPDIQDALILAADTLVFKAGTVFGKPETRAEATHMLASYSGNSHTVVTALCALDLKEHTVYEETSESTVYFAPLRPAEIDRYLQTDEWKDAAGGYKIQGKASLFIRKIEGSYSGIMGLPLHSLYAILKKAGLDIL